MTLADRIGLPKEHGDNSGRCLLSPSGVRVLVENGLDVSVESGLGEAMGYSDDEYTEVGAVQSSTEDTWNSKLILKLKAPTIEESARFFPGQSIAAIMHAEGKPELVERFLEKQVDAYSFEFFQSESGDFPLMLAHGEIAGHQAVLYAWYHLQSPQGGKGIMLSGFEGLRPVNVVIIGSGNVGRSATATALGLGAKVSVLCSNSASVKRARERLSNERCGIYVNSERKREELIEDADIVIGAILESTFDTPAMITEDMVQSMETGSVIVDGTSGYGPGYIATFERETSLEYPYFIKHGIVHIKIENLPAGVPRSSVEKISHHFPPYLVSFARSVLDDSYVDTISERGRITRGGEVAHEVVRRHLIDWRSRKN